MATTQKIKSKIFDQISGIENESMLRQIKQLITDVTHNSLTQDQKDFIDMGLNDIKEGRVISEADLKNDVTEWLAMKKKVHTL